MVRRKHKQIQRTKIKSNSYDKTKAKRTKKIEILLINKTLLQVHSLKYLGIIFDIKLTFREYIDYVAEKCTKLIFALSESAKGNGG